MASQESRQKQRSPGEAEEDAVFAAAVLGLVHDRVRDVGNLFRVIGDTAGGLAGGGIKVVGATVNVRSWSHSGDSADCEIRTCFGYHWEM